MISWFWNNSFHCYFKRFRPDIGLRVLCTLCQHLQSVSLSAPRPGQPESDRKKYEGSQSLQTPSYLQQSGHVLLLGHRLLSVLPSHVLLQLELVLGHGVDALLDGVLGYKPANNCISAQVHTIKYNLFHSSRKIEVLIKGSLLSAKVKTGRLSPDNLHLFGLTESVTSVLRLLVIVGIEVEVVEDDGVGSRKIDAETS